MKKNILKVTLVAAFALVAGYNVYTSQKSSDVMSDLANVKALASGESSGSSCRWKRVFDCYKNAIHIART